MPTDKKPTAVSRVLAAKDANDIWEPTPTLFSFQGVTYPIGPMPNRLRLKLAGEFSTILGLFEQLGKSNLDSLQNGNVSDALRTMDILSVMPQIITILLPNAVHIVATVTGIDEKIVEDKMPLGRLMLALQLILEAEDFPLLMRSFASMAAAFRLPGEAKTEE